MRVTDEKLLEMVKHVLKNHVTLEVRSRPEFHAGEHTDDRYLCLVLDDEIIGSSVALDGAGAVHSLELKLW